MRTARVARQPPCSVTLHQRYGGAIRKTGDLIPMDITGALTKALDSSRPMPESMRMSPVVSEDLLRLRPLGSCQSYGFNALCQPLQAQRYPWGSRASAHVETLPNQTSPSESRGGYIEWLLQTANHQSRSALTALHTVNRRAMVTDAGSSHGSTDSRRSWLSWPRWPVSRSLSQGPG